MAGMKRTFIGAVIIRGGPLLLLKQLKILSLELLPLII
jgi:hypothetical protein